MLNDKNNNLDTEYDRRRFLDIEYVSVKKLDKGELYIG